jgi:hypothetical protein
VTVKSYNQIFVAWCSFSPTLVQCGTGQHLTIIAGPAQLRSLVSARDADDCAVDFAEFSRINQKLYIDGSIGVEGIA